MIKIIITLTDGIFTAAIEITDVMCYQYLYDIKGMRLCLKRQNSNENEWKNVYR